MYDIKPLEEEWKKYKKKKRKPWLIGSGILVLFLLFLFFFSNKTRVNLSGLNTYLNSFKSVNSPIGEMQEKNNKKVSRFVINDPLMTIEFEKKIQVNEVKNDENVNLEKESPADILVDIPILDGKEHKRSNASHNGRKKMHLNIIKSTNVTAYKDVERRFKQSHDIDDSLFLARSYYKKGNYKKSEYWALQTNKVNSNIEESMLIFVKSKMKLGRKNEARNILRKYVKTSNSQEAKKLLYRIENAKF